MTDDPLDGEQASARARRRSAVGLGVMCGLLTALNLTNHLLIGDLAYVPVNLIGAAAGVGVARWAGVDSAGLGFESGRLRRGLIVGAAVAALLGVIVAVVTALPATRGVFDDDRFLDVARGEMLAEVLWRIPLGTALAEEILFRGALLGVLCRLVPRNRAVVAAAALFGLWHVLGSFGTLEGNGIGESIDGGVPATVSTVVVTVLVTGAAGVGFAALRFWGRSIATPVLAHWALNGWAYLAGWLVVTNS